MNLISREKASHWYLPDGTPYHTVQKADGSGPRPVTLRDARKVGAYPSVTNVLGTIAKPGLDAWKLEQGILAALTLPKGRTEPVDVYARRVVEDMDAQVTAAAAFGTAVHALCQEYLQDGTIPVVDDKLLEHWQPWKQWCDSNVLNVRRVENVVVNDREGYAGTMDLECELLDLGWCIVDFKTQNVKLSGGKKKPAFYETWLLQLIAYADAINQPTHRLVNVVIDTDRPGPVFVHVWQDDPAAWAAWAAALELWVYMRGYRPPARNPRLKFGTQPGELKDAA